MQNTDSFNLSGAWGLETTVDLKGCDPELVRNPDAIREFVVELVDKIDMVCYGEPQIVHFGSGDKEGYTLVQLIETSLISAHFANEANAAYINVFSCKGYDPEFVAQFFKERFDAKSMETRVSYRY